MIVVLEYSSYQIYTTMNLLLQYSIFPSDLNKNIEASLLLQTGDGVTPPLLFASLLFVL